MAGGDISLVEEDQDQLAGNDQRRGDDQADEAAANQEHESGEDVRDRSAEAFTGKEDSKASRCAGERDCRSGNDR